MNATPSLRERRTLIIFLNRSENVTCLSLYKCGVWNLTLQVSSAERVETESRQIGLSGGIKKLTEMSFGAGPELLKLSHLGDLTFNPMPSPPLSTPYIPLVRYACLALCISAQIQRNVNGVDRTTLTIFSTHNGKQKTSWILFSKVLSRTGWQSEPDVSIGVSCWRKDLLMNSAGLWVGCFNWGHFILCSL